MRTIRRTTHILATVVATATWLVTPLPAQTNRNDREAEAALQAAINREVIDGNLHDAIAQYTKLIETHASSRAVAAKALYHLGQAHEKLGNAEARKAYERIAREFADQKDVAADAGRRLAAMSGPQVPGRPSSSLVWRSRNAPLGGSVSPDGRYLSFVDWDTGDLALRDVATGQERRIVEARNQPNAKSQPNANYTFAEESVISRDGRFVAYNWWEKARGRPDLRIANLSGDPNPHRLYDDQNVSWLEPRDWSPDGKSIAVVISLKKGDDQIGLVSVADGSLRVLRSGDWRGDPRIFFSPDGKYLGYDLPQGDATGRDVWVTAIDGTGDSPLVVHPGNDVMMGWSPDGKRLLFRSNRTGSMALWSLRFSDGKPQGAPEMIKPDFGDAESLGVTRSGGLFYGIRQPKARGGATYVGSFDFRSGAVGATREVSDNFLEDNGNPCWSPDGKYLAYASTLGRSRPVLVIRSAETNRVVRELSNQLRTTDFSWEPNGRALLAQGRNLDGRTGAFRVDIETGEWTLLIEGRAADSPFWSPDGRSIYQCRVVSGDETVLIQRDMASGLEKEVIRRPFLSRVCISPDGKYVAVLSVDPSKNERAVLLVPLRGGEPREVMRILSSVALSDLKEFGRRAARVGPLWWAPDSGSLIVRNQQGPLSESELWQVPVDGSSPRKCDSKLDANILKFAVSPDGSKVAFRKDEQSGPPPGDPEIWVLENFLPSEGPDSAARKQTVSGGLP